MAPRSTMFRFLLRLIAVVLVFRALGALARVLTRLPRHEPPKPLEPKKPLVNRASAIDVPFTEER